MDGVKGKKDETGMEERGAPCQGDREKKRGKSKGEIRWTELVHSLGLPEAKMKEGLLTGEDGGESL